MRREEGLYAPRPPPSLRVKLLPEVTETNPGSLESQPPQLGFPKQIQNTKKYKKGCMAST